MAAGAQLGTVADQSLNGLTSGDALSLSLSFQVWDTPSFKYSLESQTAPLLSTRDLSYHSWARIPR